MAETADFVYIRNPLAGAVNIPVVGMLVPGENKVDRALYLKTIKHKDESGNEVNGCVDWKQLPGFTVRDPSKKQGPTDMDEAEAIAFVLGTNKPEILDELRQSEGRKKVIAAIEHQAKYLDIQSQSPATLKAMLKSEQETYKRESAVVALTKAVNRTE